jgi:hypothetical protein
VTALAAGFVGGLVGGLLVLAWRYRPVPPETRVEVLRRGALCQQRRPWPAPRRRAPW